MNPILSILTPAVPKRMLQIAELCEEIETQIKVDGLNVEHLVLIDNKKRSVGEKRDALLRAARGQYVAYVDDDDWISKDYCRQIVAAVESKPDVVTFQQGATVNGYERTVEFRLGNENEPFCYVQPPGKDGLGFVHRNAWHVCAWRRALAICSSFPAINYGEDWAFAAPLCAVAKTEIHIPKVLHFYRHDSKTTEAPPP